MSNLLGELNHKNVIKTLLDEYYIELSKKAGWSKTISDEFCFKGVGGDTSKAMGTKGKEAYIETINRFYSVFERASIKDLIVSDHKAYVTANYDLVSPKGGRMNFDIVEVWTVLDDKLDTLTIYFDTSTWNGFFSA